MNLIDPRTVILLASVMSGLMSLVLYALKRNYPASIKGLGEWSAALLMIFMGGLLAIGYGTLPDFVSISMARALLAFGLYFSYLGSQRFFGIAPRVVPWVITLMIVMLVQLWFTFVHPNFHVRLVLANTLAGSLFTLQASLFFRQGSFTFAKMMTLAVLIAMAAIQFMRLATSFMWPMGGDMFDTDPPHLIYVTSFAFCILLYSMGAVLMATERLHAELEHLAHHDSLTNALTRRHISEACRQELARCRRHGRSMALLMLDLDHFKAVNDTYGHQTGDRVLINFVAKVNALLRQPDRLGRFGGEEFVLLLPETSLDEAISVAERIRAVCVLSEQAPSCTVSIGITTRHQDKDTLDTLLARADAALYRAKAHGRNRIETA